MVRWYVDKGETGVKTLLKAGLEIIRKIEENRPNMVISCIIRQTWRKYH